MKAFCKLCRILYQQKSTANRLPWMTCQLKRLIRKKQRIYNRAKLYNKSSDWKAFKEIQLQTKSTLRQQRLKFLADSLNKNQNDRYRNKNFWQFIKYQKQDSTGISMLQTSSATVFTSPEIAETLNNQFKSVFTTENKHNIPKMPA